MRGVNSWIIGAMCFVAGFTIGVWCGSRPAPRAAAVSEPNRLDIASQPGFARPSRPGEKPLTSTWETRMREAVAEAMRRPEWRASPTSRIGAYCFQMERENGPLLGGECAAPMFAIADRLSQPDREEWVDRTLQWLETPKERQDRYERYGDEWAAPVRALREMPRFETWEACANISRNARTRAQIAAAFEQESKRQFPAGGVPRIALLQEWPQSVLAELRRWRPAVVALKNSGGPLGGAFRLPTATQASPP